MRRVPSSDALIPALYPHGISTGDFTEALAAIPGPKAAGWSASNIVGLEEGWEAQDEQWTGRELAGKRHVHGWADGLCFNVRLEDQRRCILVLMGALPEGTKELLAVIDAERESKLSWAGFVARPQGPRMDETRRRRGRRRWTGLLGRLG